MPFFSLTAFIGNSMNRHGLDVVRRDQPESQLSCRRGVSPPPPLRERRPVQIVLPRRGRRPSVTFEDDDSEYEVEQVVWVSTPGHYERGVGVRKSRQSHGRQQYHEPKQSPTNSYSPYENVNVESRSSLPKPNSSHSYSYSPYEGVNVETRSSFPRASSYQNPSPSPAPEYTFGSTSDHTQNPYANVNVEERVPDSERTHKHDSESRQQPRNKDTRRVRFA